MREFNLLVHREDGRWIEYEDTCVKVRQSLEDGTQRVLWEGPAWELGPFIEGIKLLFESLPERHSNR